MSSFRNIGHCEIPNDWADISLGDEDKRPLLVMRNGLTKTQSDHDGTFKVSRIETISNGVIDESRVKYLSEVSREEEDKYLIRKDDMLFSHINSDVHLGKTAIAKKDYNDLLQGMNLLLFRVNEEILDPEFLFFTMNYYKNIGVFISICSRAVNQSSINQGKLKALKVPLPPLPEQYNIAHILSKIQSAIETQKKIIQTTTELKKALMQKLFTEGLKGEPQKETEIGLVPKSWEVVKLKEIVNFTTGKLNANQAKSDGKYPFFTCSQETFWIDSYAFDTEAVLLSGNNARAIYSVKYFNGKFNAYQRTYVITIKDTSQFSYTFLKYILSFNLERLRKLSIGTSTKYLTLGILENLEILKPKIDEQENIANALSIVESKIESSQAKLKSLQSLFKSMLHHLMTGQIRVKDLKVS